MPLYINGTNRSAIVLPTTADAFNLFREILKSGHIIKFNDAAAWANVVDGTGSLVTSSMIISARTGTTAASTAVGYINPGYLADLSNPTRIDWDKKLLIAMRVLLNASHANFTGYIGFIEQNTPAVTDCADLAAKGVALHVHNLALKGQAFDTELLETDLAQNLTAATPMTIYIYHEPGVGVKFYKLAGGTLTLLGTNTREPSGQAGAYTRFIVAADNGDQATNFNLEICDLTVWQAG